MASTTEDNNDTTSSTGAVVVEESSKKKRAFETMASDNDIKESVTSDANVEEQFKKRELSGVVAGQQEEISDQRKPPKKRRMTRIEMVDKWNSMHAILVEYHKNHTERPVLYKGNKALAQWVRHQRSYNRDHTLSDDRKAKLESVPGFQWQAQKQDQWSTMYEHLVDYKQKYGDCIVARDHPEMPKLGPWVHRQRIAHHANTISTDRKEKLDELGFVWRRQVHNPWSVMYKHLVDFTERNGSCVIPPKRDKNTTKLSGWAKHQRLLWKKGQLTKEQVKLLEDIGFPFVRAKKANKKEMATQKQELVVASESLDQKEPEDTDTVEERQESNSVKSSLEANRQVSMQDLVGAASLLEQTESSKTQNVPESSIRNEKKQEPDGRAPDNKKRAIHRVVSGSDHEENPSGKERGISKVRNTIPWIN